MLKADSSSASGGEKPLSESSSGTSLPGGGSSGSSAGGGSGGGGSGGGGVKVSGVDTVATVLTARMESLTSFAVPDPDRSVRGSPPSNGSPSSPTDGMGGDSQDGN